MRSEQWQVIKEIYLAASDVEDGERAAFLARRCGHDQTLMNSVVALFDADSSVPELFDRPAVEAFSPATNGTAGHALIGRQIGAYRIVRRIASGGMGQVYLATRSDEHFYKDVAIKLVRPELVSEEVVQRFADERQTLAGLEHPNIARLLDGGITDDGYPYFIMEYIEGQPIDKYCDHEELTINQRLELFDQICRAVQFSHQHLIVHRDLKPGNILITMDGRAKLLDFGIAKVLANQPTTPGDEPVTRDIRLTPEYASPEQIRGEPISTRSDIYSLGVVLYQLLTGHHPYGTKSRTLFELERQISDKSPDKPSTAVDRTVEIPHTDGRPTTQISPQTVSKMRRVQPPALRKILSGDVDAIVLKAMHLSPDRRYASADQFADDIQRHLRGLPVIAQPDTFGYRVRKFVSRRLGIVIASAAAIVALLGGIIGTSWQARIANSRRDAALSAQANAVTEAERARVEALKSDRVVQFFQSMLGAADPNKAGPDATIGEVVQHFADWVSKDYGDDPEVESAIHTAVGQTFAALGRYDDAEKHVRQALELQVSLHDPPHADIAGRHRDLAELLYKTHDFRGAEKHARLALEMNSESLGKESPESARDLNNLAAIRRAQGDLNEAETLLLQSLEIRRSQKSPGAIASTLNNLANLMLHRGEFDECEKLCREALGIRREMYGDHHPLVAQSIDNLAVTLARMERYDDAAALHREGLEIMQQFLGKDHPDLFLPLSNLAGVLAKKRSFAQAVPYFEKSLEIGTSFLPPSDPQILGVRLKFGECLLALDRYQDAESEYLRVHNRVREDSQDGKSIMQRARDGLIQVYEALGKDEQAARFRDSGASTKPGLSIAP